jgi:serine/threonine protein kinase
MLLPERGVCLCTSGGLILTLNRNVDASRLAGSQGLCWQVTHFPASRQNPYPFGKSTHCNVIMEKEPTQPTQATQPRVAEHERMSSNNLEPAREDIADLLCILHPCTLAASEVVAHTYNRSPQHVLRSHDYDKYDDGVSESFLKEEEMSRPQASPLTGETHNLGLALRLSTPLVRPYMGFVFGRSAQYCDVLLDTDTTKRISNVHFRIFADNSGVPMLEDVSTNGTWVNGVRLRCQTGTRTHVLNGGSVIQIYSHRPEDNIKFLVLIPNRHGVLDGYKANLDRMLKRMAIPEAGIHTSGAATTIRTVPLSLRRFSTHWTGDDRYDLLGQIDRGAFGTVYQLSSKSDGQMFAAKELEKRRFISNERFNPVDNELQIMKAISHPNIVQYIGHHETEKSLYIIMEFVPGGNLQQYLNHYSNLVEPVAKTMSTQVLNALLYLHKKDITHRDISPDNILLAETDPANITIKLCDFGLSKVVSDNETFMKTFCGVLLYCAPEVYPQYRSQAPRQTRKRARGDDSMRLHSSNGYTQSVDIWSYGAVLWFALCLQPPFESVVDATGDGMFNKITTTSPDTSELHRVRVSQSAIDLMLEMLNADPSARPSLAYCLNHSWFGVSRPVVNDAAEMAEGGDMHVIIKEHEQASFANLGHENQKGFGDSQSSVLNPHSRNVEKAVMVSPKDTTLTPSWNEDIPPGGDSKSTHNFMNNVFRTDNESSVAESYSKSGPGAWTQMSGSTPGLTHASTGPSDRYGWEVPQENDADSIRTDNENNDLDFDDKRTYSDIFVSELRAGLDKVLHSKNLGHQGRLRMSAALPDLLKAYVLSLARRARPGIEREMIVFIRHMRGYVKSSRKYSIHAAADEFNAQHDRQNVSRRDPCDAYANRCSWTARKD